MTPERWMLAVLAVAVIANAVAGILGARANDRNIRRLLEANKFYREAIESLNNRFLDHRHGECERCKAPMLGSVETVRWTCVQCGFQATGQAWAKKVTGAMFANGVLGQALKKGRASQLEGPGA